MREQLSKKQRRKRALRVRRRAATAMILLAIAAGVLAWSAVPALTAALWGGGALALIAEAALLYRKQPLPLAAYLLPAVLIAALVAGGFRVRGYVFSDMGIVPVEATLTELRVTDAWPENLSRCASLRTLDLRDATVEDFTPALTLKKLTLLDARGNHRFTEADAEAVREALPQCEVKWSMPIYGNYYDSDVQEIDVTSLSLTAGEIAELQAQYPDKTFHTGVVTVMGMEVDPSAEALDLSAQPNIDAEEVAVALKLLSEVKQADLRGTPLSAETIGGLCAAFPNVRFLCTCQVEGGSMSTEDTVVTLMGGGFADLRSRMAFIDYMPNLQYIDARAVTLTDEEIKTLQADPRADKVVYSFSVYGRQVSTLDVSLNLDGVKLAGREEVEQILKTLPRLQKLSLCDCGLSDEDMAALFDAHPGVKLVWWISFGRYRLRTDATAFTTNLFANNTYHYDSTTFAPLRYCTDLMMLDLGHCDITTIDWMAGLTKLRVLILADNKITDISPLAGMEDLEYVELFLNKIRDFSPLANKQKLIDLNIYYCPIGDITPITTDTALQRLWIGQCGLSGAQTSQLKQALPGCKINTKGSASTGHGWREHKRYEVLKQMYKQGVYIPFEQEGLF